MVILSLLFIHVDFRSISVYFVISVIISWFWAKLDNHEQFITNKFCKILLILSFVVIISLKFRALIFWILPFWGKASGAILVLIHMLDNSIDNFCALCSWVVCPVAWATTTCQLKAGLTSVTAGLYWARKREKCTLFLFSSEENCIFLFQFLFLWLNAIVRDPRGHHCCAIRTRKYTQNSCILI